MASNLLNAINTEMKNGFLRFLCEQTNLNYEEICNLWERHCNIPQPDDKSTKSYRTAIGSGDLVPVIKPKKPTASRPDSLSRDQQTPIQFDQIDKLKVAELKKYNKERGLPISGNRGILIEHLKGYESGIKNANANANANANVDNDDNDDNEAEAEEGEEAEEKPKAKASKKASTSKAAAKTKRPTSVAKPKKVNIEATKITLEYAEDGDGNMIVDGDLVCESENDEMIVVAYKDESGNVVDLTREKIERCNELNIAYRA